MNNLEKQAESVAIKLLQNDESQLYEKLGMVAKAIAIDPIKGSSFEPEVTYDGSEMGMQEDLLEFGEKVFSRWHVQLYSIVCGSESEDKEDRQKILTAFGTAATLSAYISGILVTSFGVAPAIAVLLAAIVVKRFFTPVYEEFCILWKNHLPE